MVTVDEPSAASAPPRYEAEFEVRAQLVVVTVESSSAKITPPSASAAEFECIEQFVTATVEFPRAKSNPPRSATFSLIVQLVAMTIELSAKMAPPSVARFAETTTDVRRSSLPGLM
jgi:hypothetical protein